MKLKVGDKEFTVKTVDTPQGRKKGLAGIKPGSMPSNSGLVLKFNTASVIPITMNGMLFPIDIIFIGEGKVQGVRKGNLGAEEDIIIKKESDMVLEVNSGDAAGIKIGDAAVFVGAKSDDGTIEMAKGGSIEAAGSMHVLDENGAVQMNIEGDERVYSRIHTKQLVKLAEQADKSKSSTDYKKVGRAMVRIVTRQDTQKQQFSKN